MTDTEKKITEFSENAANEANVKEDIKRTIDDEVKKVPKKSNWLVIVGTIAACACIIACLVLTIVTLNISRSNAKKIDKVNETVAKIDQINETVTKLSSFIGPAGDVAQEDDVPIGIYKIRSTKHISDAYIAGDLSELTDEEKSVVEMAEKVFDEVLTEGMTDYEKEEALYVWIRDNVKHDDGITVAIPTTGEYADNPYGVLSTHKAVCVGYATTLRLLLQMQGIECMVVHDTSLVHSWNEIKLDGDWYMTDVYMDAESKSFSNFNMTADKACEGHDWNQQFFPQVTGVKYCYAVMNSKPFESLEATADDFYNILDAGKTESAYIRFQGEDAAINLQLAYIMAERAENIYMESDLYDSCMLLYSYSSIGENDYVLEFSLFNYSDQEGETDFGDNTPTEEQISDAEDILINRFDDFFTNHMGSGENYWEDDWDDDWHDHWGADCGDGTDRPGFYGAVG